MDELAGMTDAELLNATRDLEAEGRKTKQLITRITQDCKQYDARIKENQEKLKMST